MGKEFTHLTREQKTRIKQMLDSGKKKSDIASALGIHRNTIYNELKRGTKNGQYDPYYSEKRYQDMHKGRIPILSINSNLAEYISVLILEKHKSPEEIIAILNNNDKYKSIITSRNTIYNAIDSGLIPNVTRTSLNSNTTTVFNDGCVHIAKWVKDLLKITDGDTLYFEVKDNKIIFSKTDN